MLRTLGGYALGASAFVACPCHLPQTLPLVPAVLTGTSAITAGVPGGETSGADTCCAAMPRVLEDRPANAEKVVRSG